MKNKKLLLVLLVMVLFSCAAAEASIGSAIENYFERAWNFEQTYDRNPKLWDFVLFALIFNFVAWLGLANKFKENKVAVYLFSIVLGVVLGLAAVKAGISVGFFMPFVKNIMFFLVAGIIIYVLIKMNVNTFWAIILGIVITFVAFNVLGIFEAIDVSDVDVSSSVSGLKRSVLGDSLEEVNNEISPLAQKYSRMMDQLDLTTGEKNELVNKMRSEGLISEEARDNLLIAAATIAPDLFREFLKIGSITDKVNFVNNLMELTTEIMRRSSTNPRYKQITTELLQDQQALSSLESTGVTLERKKRIQEDEENRKEYSEIIEIQEQIKTEPNPQERLRLMEEAIRLTEQKLNALEDEE